jgi:hypothetical protein
MRSIYLTLLLVSLVYVTAGIMISAAAPYPERHDMDINTKVAVHEERLRALELRLPFEQSVTLERRLTRLEAVSEGNKAILQGIGAFVLAQIAGSLWKLITRKEPT